jgi:hypothetical protein
MAVVAMPSPREVVRQDVEAVAGLYRNLGAPVAEQVVMRALGELALTMAGAVEKVRAQDLRDLPGRLQHLRRLSEEMGLVSMARVASDARHCLERADGTAFAAVWARLVRVAERSIAPADDAADRSC